MFTSASKQLLITEKVGQDADWNQLDLWSFQVILNANGMVSIYRRRIQSTPPVTGPSLPLGKEQDLGFQELFVQRAAILWLFCYSGVGITSKPAGIKAVSTNSPMTFWQYFAWLHI